MSPKETVISPLAYMIFSAILALSLSAPAYARDAKKNAADPEDMVFVEGGCFEMGDPYPQKARLDGDPDEKPLHAVCVSDYYIGKHEVTRSEFSKFVDETGYKTQAETGQGCYIIYGGRVWQNQQDLYWERLKQDDNHPVACVTWNDAGEFIKWKGKKTGLKYRLPTEAEWEFAARARGKVMKYSWGNDGDRPEGNVADEAAHRELAEVFPENTYWKGYDDGYVFSSPVGAYKPNGLGIYDMSGGVWEWMYDLYDVDYYKKSPKDNPKGNKTDGTHVRKGGSWADDWRHQRIANRSRSFDFRARFDLGFRLAMEP